MATQQTPPGFLAEEVFIVALMLRGTPTRADLGRYMRQCKNGDSPTFACGIIACEIHGHKEKMYNFGPVVLCSSHAQAVTRICNQLHLDYQRYRVFQLAMTWQRMIQIADQRSVLYARQRIWEDLARMLPGLRESLGLHILAMQPPPLPSEEKKADLPS